MSTNVNIESMYYTVAVFIEIPKKYTTRNFGQGRNVTSFVQLSDQENDRVHQHLRKVLDTTPRIVSVRNIPLHQQRKGSEHMKDAAILL